MATISKIAFKGVTYDLKAQGGGIDAAELNKKVDKETGKGLSTNDYTTEEKTKLANIEEGANKTIVDSELSDTSENPVQNKVIKAALANAGGGIPWYTSDNLPANPSYGDIALIEGTLMQYYNEKYSVNPTIENTYWYSICELNDLYGNNFTYKRVIENKGTNFELNKGYYFLYTEGTLIMPDGLYLNTDIIYPNLGITNPLISIYINKTYSFTCDQDVYVYQPNYRCINLLDIYKTILFFKQHDLDCMIESQSGTNIYLHPQLCSRTVLILSESPIYARLITPQSLEDGEPVAFASDDEYYKITNGNNSLYLKVINILDQYHPFRIMSDTECQVYSYYFLPGMQAFANQQVQEKFLELQSQGYTGTGFNGQIVEYSQLSALKTELTPTQSTITDDSTVLINCILPTIQSGTAINTLTVTVSKADTSKHNIEETLIFTVGDTPAITITGVSWANSDIPTFKAGKTYEIHIIYNATIDKFLATYAVYE